MYHLFFVAATLQAASSQLSSLQGEERAVPQPLPLDVPLQPLAVPQQLPLAVPQQLPLAVPLQPLAVLLQPLAVPQTLPLAVPLPLQLAVQLPLAFPLPLQLVVQLPLINYNNYTEESEGDLDSIKQHELPWQSQS